MILGSHFDEANVLPVGWKTVGGAFGRHGTKSRVLIHCQLGSLRPTLVKLLLFQEAAPAHSIGLKRILVGGLLSRSSGNSQSQPFVSYI